MIWLSGGIPRGFRASVGPTLGLMLQPDKGNKPQRGIPWAMDNGCFSKVRPFDEPRWERWLRTCQPWLDSCLFAVAPDVVGDAVATQQRSRPYFFSMREWGYPIAFASQDGATRDLVPWDDIDCLFVGGSDAWKLSDASVALIQEAQERGLWTHMGRCQARESIGGRIGAAHALGMDSGDGTVLARDPSRLGRVVRGLDALNAQIPMESVS